MLSSRASVSHSSFLQGWYDILQDIDYSTGHQPEPSPIYDIHKAMAKLTRCAANAATHLAALDPLEDLNGDRDGFVDRVLSSVQVLCSEALARRARIWSRKPPLRRLVGQSIVLCALANAFRHLFGACSTMRENGGRLLRTALLDGSAEYPSVTLLLTESRIAVINEGRRVPLGEEWKLESRAGTLGQLDVLLGSEGVWDEREVSKTRASMENCSSIDLAGLSNERLCLGQAKPHLTTVAGEEMDELFVLRIEPLPASFWH